MKHHRRISMYLSSPFPLPLRMSSRERERHRISRMDRCITHFECSNAATSGTFTDSETEASDEAVLGLRVRTARRFLSNGM